MTRGTAILLTNWRSITTTEFNGDMYLESGSNGNLLLWYLQHIQSKKDFLWAVKDFNEFTFGYEGMLTYPTKRHRKIVFSEKTYYRDWFSDFLFFLNFGRRPVVIVDMNGVRIDLKQHEIAIFYFGKFYSFHYGKLYDGTYLKRASVTQYTHI